MSHVLLVPHAFGRLCKFHEEDLKAQVTNTGSLVWGPQDSIGVIKLWPVMVCEAFSDESQHLLLHSPGVLVLSPASSNCHGLLVMHRATLLRVALMWKGNMSWKGKLERLVWTLLLVVTGTNGIVIKRDQNDLPLQGGWSLCSLGSKGSLMWFRTTPGWLPWDVAITVADPVLPQSTLDEWYNPPGLGLSVVPHKVGSWGKGYLDHVTQPSVTTFSEVE